MTFFLSFLSGIVFFHSFNYFPFTSGLAFFSALTLLVFRKKYVLAIVLAVGILYAFSRYAPEQDLSFLRGKELLVSGAFVSEASGTASGRLIQQFQPDTVVIANAVSPIKNFIKKDINIISDTDFEVGKTYQLLIRLSKDSTRLNPGLMKNESIYANLLDVRETGADRRSASAFQDARARLDSYVSANFNADSGAFISSITTGRRIDMSEELRDAFNSTGLAHILSISGTHFGLFSLLLFGFFRLLIRFLPYRLLQRITIYMSPSQAAAALSLPFMFGYLGLSGWQIPAVRSFVMIGLFLAGLLIGRKRFWLNSLLFAAFVIALWDPGALFGLSFQLSFLAILFIGFFAGYKERGGKNSGERKGNDAETAAFSRRYLIPGIRILRASVLLTLAASLGTAPLVVYYFHYFSVISPLTNLLITPLIGFVLLPAALFSSLVFLITGYYPFASFIGTTADISLYLVKSAAGIPFADVKLRALPAYALVFLYAAVAVYLVYGRKKVILIAAATLFAAFLFFAPLFKKHNVNITFLDVGQGDSAVVGLPGEKVIVVDTGRNGKETAAFLKYLGTKTIDAVVLTHSHPDHTGGSDYLLRHFTVREFWDNGRLIYPEGFLYRVERRVLERGDVIEGKDYKIYALHPYGGFYTMNGDEYYDENNGSLVLKIETAGRSFLFAGDVEEEAESDIYHLGKWIRSDVIKIPHHGGRTSASEAFLNSVSPEIAVISAGRDNPFGHPHRETLDILDGVKVYRTDKDGAVKITEESGGLKVKTYKDFLLEKTRNFEGELRNIRRLFEVW